MAMIRHLFVCLLAFVAGSTSASEATVLFMISEPEYQTEITKACGRRWCCST